MVKNEKIFKIVFNRAKRLLHDFKSRSDVLFLTEKVVLAESLVKDDRNRIGEVERTEITEHRDTDRVIVIAVDERFGKSFGFFSEQYERSVRKIDVHVRLFRLGRGIEHRRAGVTLHKLAQRVVISYIDLIPVIESGTFYGAVAYLESERTDEMKPRVSTSASARDIARILRNFGFNQNNVKHKKLRYVYAFLLQNDQNADVETLRA